MSRSSSNVSPAETRIEVPQPFDWDGTFAFLRKRAVSGLEAFTDTTYERLGAVRITYAKPHLVVSNATYIDAAKHLFDVDADAKAIDGTLRREPLFARAPRGVRVPGAWSAFEVAVRAIIGQQITVAAHSTLLGRLVAQFGRFPSPEQLAETTLGGMPRRRAETLRTLAAGVADGSIALTRGASLEESIARLTALPGIGPWTAHYIAMRALREPDAFPSGDLILRRNAGNLTERELLRKAEAWRPFRAYAAILLWRL